MMDCLEAGWVDRLYWFVTEDMLLGGMTQGTVDREAFIQVGELGVWKIAYDAPQWESLTKNADEHTNTVCESTSTQASFAYIQGAVLDLQTLD